MPGMELRLAHKSHLSGRVMHLTVVEVDMASILGDIE